MSFFWKPSFTPCTMFATFARRVPESALASLLSLAATNDTLSPSTLTVTCGVRACLSVPSGPFTVTASLSTVTWTLSGTTTGYFAIRDICRRSLDHDAEDFAADTRLARAAVGHHAPRGRHDGDTEPVHHARDVVAAAIDAQPRARDALDLLDHGLAGVVLEADLDHGMAVLVADREVLDVALVLQDLGDGALHLRGGHEHADLLRRLRVADAGQHVGDGITHAHDFAPTSSPWSCRGSRRASRSRGSCCARGRTCGTCRAGVRSWRSDCEDARAKHRAAAPAGARAPDRGRR